MAPNIGVTRAYFRVSTIAQTVENQSHTIMQYALKNGLRLDEVVEETVSGTKSYKVRKLGALLEKSQRADIIIVTELTRLGRSMLEIMEILNTALKKGVFIHAIKENFRLDDSLNSKVVAFCFSLCAELERNLISMRTRDALARKKAEGMTLGRPKGSLSLSKLSGKEHDISALLAKGVSQASIAKILECSPTTLHSFIVTRGLKSAKAK